jgi:uncharacterized protein
MDQGGPICFDAISTDRGRTMSAKVPGSDHRPSRSTMLTKLSHVPQASLIAVVRGYQIFLSPHLGSACRFAPTCSAYALDALAQHGTVMGSYLTVARLLRCHPWCAGGHDPVPQTHAATALFTRLLGTDASVAPPAETPASPPFSKTSL